MANPICGRCGLEMKVADIGWLAIYMAYDPPTPYEVRRGDLCECPNPHCRSMVLTKFAQGRPMGQFLGEPFEDEIRTALRTGKFVVVWERIADRAKVSGSVEQYLANWLADRVDTRQRELGND